MTEKIRKLLKNLTENHKGKFHDAKSFQYAKLTDFLQELIKFNHQGNFDRVMAFMIGMYHTRELYNSEVKDVLEDRSADSWFDTNYY